MNHCEPVFGSLILESSTKGEARVASMRPPSEVRISLLRLVPCRWRDDPELEVSSENDGLARTVFS